MKGVLPALAGVLFLILGFALTWFVATSSYTYPCRLSLELDNYSCWGLMGLPLAGGIGSMALGAAALLRSVLTLPMPRQIRIVRSSKIMFVLGLMALAAIFLLTIQLFPLSSLGVNLQTLLFLTFMGVLVFMGAEWIEIYVHPSRRPEHDSAWPSE